MAVDGREVHVALTHDVDLWPRRAGVGVTITVVFDLMVDRFQDAGESVDEIVARAFWGRGSAQNLDAGGTRVGERSGNEKGKDDNEIQNNPDEILRDDSD